MHSLMEVYDLHPEKEFSKYVLKFPSPVHQDGGGWSLSAGQSSQSHLYIICHQEHKEPFAQIDSGQQSGVGFA